MTKKALALKNIFIALVILITIITMLLFIKIVSYADGKMSVTVTDIFYLNT